MDERLTVALAMGPGNAGLVLPPELSRRLHAIADVAGDVISDFDDPLARKQLACADVLLTAWDCPFVSASVLDDAPRLRAIVHAAGTVKQHLSPAVWERNIAVSSAAAANAYPVAQYTISAILLAGKRAFRFAHDYKAGQFERKAIPAAGNYMRTAGVIGASRIGRLMVPMLAAHGFRVLVSDPTLDAGSAAALAPGQLVELDELLSQSDVVTIHAPALPDTHHLLDERRLSLLRDGSILVNTARGQLVDTEALTRHCLSGRIDAVLDVTDPEPLPPGHPLMSLSNVLVTPHVAGAMGNEVRQLGEFAVAEIERLTAGQPLAGQVHAAQLDVLA